MNPYDKYSYHFTVEYEDGTEIQESHDAQYKNANEKSHAIKLAQDQNPDAWNIVFEGVSDNYPTKKK
jgi:hypothetical protein